MIVLDESIYATSENQNQYWYNIIRHIHSEKYFLNNAKTTQNNAKTIEKTTLNDFKLNN